MTDIAAIYREILEGAWSGGSQAIIDEVYADDYTFLGPLTPEPVRGRDGERAHLAQNRAAFPDLTFTIHEQIVEGDRVVSRWTATGTQEGELAGLPPTGIRGKDVRGVSIARFSDGKLVSAWVMFDVFGLLMQLGHIPQPAAVA